MLREVLRRLDFVFCGAPRRHRWHLDQLAMPPAAVIEQVERGARLERRRPRLTGRLVKRRRW
eukprot:3461393-Prymnesium_polylepis.1